jgi:hypothetical protein
MEVDDDAMGKRGHMKREKLVKIMKLSHATYHDDGGRSEQGIGSSAERSSEAAQKQNRFSLKSSSASFFDFLQLFCFAFVFVAEWRRSRGRRGTKKKRGKLFFPLWLSRKPFSIGCRNKRCKRPPLQ